MNFICHKCKKVDASSDQHMCFKLDQILKQMKERCDKATPGPWVKGSYSGICYDKHMHDRRICNYKYELHTEYACVSIEPNITLIGWDEHGTVLKRGETAEFIAHSRIDMPNLIEALEECLIEIRHIYSNDLFELSKFEKFIITIFENKK